MMDNAVNLSESEFCRIQILGIFVWKFLTRLIDVGSCSLNVGGLTIRTGVLESIEWRK